MNYLFALITEEKLHITLVQLEWKNGKKIVCGGVGVCWGGRGRGGGSWSEIRGVFKVFMHLFLVTSVINTCIRK